MPSMKPNRAPEPYRSTPVFDEATLPVSLRRAHRTKPGVWGVIRVLQGELTLCFTEPPEQKRLSPGADGVLEPDQSHFVLTEGPMRMQIDFYTQAPRLAASEEA
ncbi:DUF1971 domain-containing protein [Phenylobacterium sp.]|uniref:DUF1971 domain-containing protein n=1 Tax=Phenylobacterium sp. TaxID=1871053 RepID=UPI002733ACEA|nr:DUF1971 domain-containing protein [Phenylobacterium sp.]MDP3854798.1 DUF1971 domain-containing protein [Phenylobacterium sp.]